jgi:ATP-dependent DNA helicase Rep
MPSRFVAEMRLDEVVTKEDPRERIRRLREELAARSTAAQAAAAATTTTAAEAD